MQVCPFVAAAISSREPFNEAANKCIDKCEFKQTDVLQTQTHFCRSEDIVSIKKLRLSTTKCFHRGFYRRKITLLSPVVRVSWDFVRFVGAIKLVKKISKRAFGELYEGFYRQLAGWAAEIAIKVVHFHIYFNSKFNIPLPCKNLSKLN